MRRNVYVAYIGSVVGGVGGWVGGWVGGGGTKFLVLYLVILWMSLREESFHAYPRLIRWDFSTVY
jgi:hypothetical protein